MVYRDEQSGELSGLSRVLSITQDDAHVFCRENQIEQEVFIIWDIIDTFYKTFGFKDLTVRFSRHDPAHFEKYLGTKEMWAKAESSLKGLLDKRGVTAIDGIGESAFYGPKLDFIAKDSLGRVLQVATIQLDFNMPERFGLECTNEKGERERIVMIHCAIMGSIERFMSTLIEHTAGNFPLWLSPVQVKVVPVREHHNAHAEGVAKVLRDAGLRIDCDTGEAGFGKKVREAKDMKIPYTIIIGDKDIEAGVVTLESRDKGKVGALSIEDVKNMLLAEHNEKK
jgi:threonyl-tRNA synthetase